MITFKAPSRKKNRLPRSLAEFINHKVMKVLLLPVLVVGIVSLFSSCVSNSGMRSSGSDQTVMLHWLTSDKEGLVRSTGSDGNLSASSKLFSGKAIETFEQSPTKSVSSWQNGRRNGETIEFFYNGRKRRVINYVNGLRDGISKEYRITGELLREESYQSGKLNGPKKEWHPNGQSYR